MTTANPKEGTISKPMTDAEFTAEVARVGYVEACAASVKRDGYPYDEEATRQQATDGLAALALRYPGATVR